MGWRSPSPSARCRLSRSCRSGCLVADAFDERIPRGDERGLLLDGLALVGLYLLSSALGLVVRRWLVDTIAIGSERVRNDLTRRLHELPLAWHHARPAGQVHATMIPELDRVEAMAQAAFGLGPALAIVLPLLVCGLVISPGLTAVACVVVPVLVLVNHFGARAVRKSTRAWQDAWMAVSRHLHTTLRTINLIRVRSADAAETTRAAVLAAAWRARPATVAGRSRSARPCMPRSPASPAWPCSLPAGRSSAAVSSSWASCWRSMPSSPSPCARRWRSAPRAASSPEPSR